MRLQVAQPPKPITFLSIKQLGGTFTLYLTDIHPWASNPKVFCKVSLPPLILLGG